MALLGKALVWTAARVQAGQGPISTGQSSAPVLRPHGEPALTSPHAFGNHRGFSVAPVHGRRLPPPLEPRMAEAPTSRFRRGPWALTLPCCDHRSQLLAFVRPCHASRSPPVYWTAAILQALSGYQATAGGTGEGPLGGQCPLQAPGAAPPMPRVDIPAPRRAWPFPVRLCLPPVSVPWSSVDLAMVPDSGVWAVRGVHLSLTPAGQPSTAQLTGWTQSSGPAGSALAVWGLDRCKPCADGAAPARPLAAAWVRHPQGARQGPRDTGLRPPAGLVSVRAGEVPGVCAPVRLRRLPGVRRGDAPLMRRSGGSSLGG